MPDRSILVIQFGIRLRELREAANLSQRGLARRLGVDHSYICMLERGRAKYPPSTKLLDKMAVCLNVERDQLYLFAGRLTEGMTQHVLDAVGRSARGSKEFAVTLRIKP